MPILPNPSPQDLAANHPAYERWLLVTAVTDVSFAALIAYLADILHSPRLGAFACLLVMCTASLLVIRRYARRGQMRASVGLFAVTLLARLVGMAVWMPDTYMLIPTFAISAVLVCAVYWSQRALWALGVLASALSVVATIFATTRLNGELPTWMLVTMSNGLSLSVLVLMLRINTRLRCALQNAWHIDREQRFLAEAGEMLAESLEMRSTLKTAAKLMVPFLSDSCVIDMLGDNGEIDRVAAFFGQGDWSPTLELVQGYKPNMHLDLDSPVVRAMRSGECILLSGIDAVCTAAVSDDHAAMMRRGRYNAILSVPFAAHGRIIGCFSLCSRGNSPPLTKAVAPVAEELGRRVGLCIDNARLYYSAQEAVRLRDDFLSIASHELRTPLTTLRLQTDGAMRLLQQQGTHACPERLHKRIAMAQQQAARLESLIRSLLDVNRVSNKASVLDSHRCDLRLMVREVVDRFHEEAARVGCALTLDARDEMWGEWDVLKLDQVVTNLVTNAIKYGPGKPIEVCLEGDEHRVNLSIADHGIGIAEKDQRRIFERFERAVSTRNYGGFGLGLWVARTLVNAAGGEISVDSRPDDGATFTVVLPRRVDGDYSGGGPGGGGGAPGGGPGGMPPGGGGGAPAGGPMGWPSKQYVATSPTQR